jgi:CRISPR-associated protein Csy3
MARTPAPKLPNVLNYERSLHPTTAAFYAVNDEGQTPVRVSRITVLGVRADPIENVTEADYASGNPQRVEAAALPIGCDRLRIAFGLTVTPSSLSPRACDRPAFRQALRDYAAAYSKADGFRELARRYATNIANARFCWRNLGLAAACEVEVRIDGAIYRFDAHAFDPNNLDVPKSQKADVDAVAAHIVAGLAGPRSTRLRVSATLDLGDGAAVWPSQEFAERGDNTDVGKVLFKFPSQEYTDATGFHEQKVGAALRTIDTWHQGYKTEGADAVQPGAPLCVNPYAQAREAHVVVRGRDGGGAKDFYTLLKERYATAPLAPDDDDHFLMANLVRGGVFPIGGKKAKPDVKSAEADAQAAATA